VSEPIDGEAASLGLFFEYQQDRGSAPVGPIQEQGDIQRLEALTEPFFELFLADGDDAGPLEDDGLIGCEQPQGIPRIVEDQVLEVRVMVHGDGLGDPVRAFIDALRARLSALLRRAKARAGLIGCASRAGSVIETGRHPVVVSWGD